MAPIFRLAPSPTGHLHLGHAYNALLNHDAARAAGGQCLVRIEDIDTNRAREHHVDAIMEDLAWLGIDPPQPVRRQSRHMADYAAALEKLRRLGVLYRCFRTRREVAMEIADAPHADASGQYGPVYRGPSRAMSPEKEAELLAAGRAFAWRISIAACRDRLGSEFARLGWVEEGKGPDGTHGAVTARPDLMGDAILARKDVPVSYHLAVVHDDGLQRISHILRGRDLFVATHLHVLLQRLLGLPTPIYRHHRLIENSKGERLAKRDRPQSLRGFRDAGGTRSALRDLLFANADNDPGAAPVPPPLG